jgi:hypothetical protein
MRKLYRTLPNVHETWKDYEEQKYGLGVIVIGTNNAVWRVEYQIETRKNQDTAYYVPRYSLSDGSINIITAETDQWLENGIYELTDEHNQASIVLWEPYSLD